jgi:predicted metal-dependent HD superfamily phosphohydrolase
LAIDSLKPLGIPDGILFQVARMIRATAHTARNDVDADTAILLDADLAILSAEERRYARYAADVRHEYDWVPNEAYRAGRAKVLESFLSRPRIYRTERMYAAAEAAARANLQKEIDQLRLPMPPKP